jgi:pyruvate dehydrogenase E1 component alpha subunit
MNVLAVYEGVKKAVERARRGEGPTLLECITYRYQGHEEGDTWITYRSKEEVEQWKKRDPIPSYREYLITSKAATEADLDSIDTRVEETIANAIEFAEKSAYTNEREALMNVFTDGYR